MSASPDASDAERYAARALRAYAAMQDSDFRLGGGLYRRDGVLGRARVAAHLWPAARAFVATLDLAGLPASLRGGWDAGSAITRDLAMLERYWVVERGAGAHASDLRRTPWSGDRYVDDNAWVGLGLVQLERLRPGRAPLARAGELWRFAAREHDQHRGGIFWVEQGRGIGRRNHDRNAVSTAPNAELRLHLAELDRDPARPWRIGPDPEALIGWVHRELGTPEGLVSDKIRGDGSIDRAIWSYNQGSMVGAHVLLARRAGHGADHLTRAETMARATLAHYAGDGFARQPPAFNAICFRNLLLLHHASADRELRAAILAALRGWADAAWDTARDERDRFHLRDDGVTLLGQSAVVSALALLAWPTEEYGRLA